MKKYKYLLVLVLVIFICFQSAAQNFSILFDINKDASLQGSNPEQFTEYNNYLYFVAYHPLYGETLWFTDKDMLPIAINPDGRVFDAIYNLIMYNDALYFLASCGTGFVNLYAYSPETGFVLVLNTVDSFPELTNISSITVFKEELIIFTYNEDDYNSLMWSLDGKNELSQIALPENAQFNRFSGFPVTTAERIYFSLESNDIRSIFMYDGKNSPVSLSDLYQTDEFNNARYAQTFGDTLFFVTYDRTTRSQNIHYYDEVNMPKMLSTSSEYPELATVFKNEMYILQDMQMWKYNFEGEGRLAFDLQFDGSIYNGEIFPHSTDYFYFFSGDVNNRKLLRYSGSGEPEILTDLTYSINESQEMTFFDNCLYFNAFNYILGNELYRFNTETMHGELFDLNNNNGSSNITDLTLFDNKLYFSATENSNYEYHLWEYNGTEAPTKVELNEKNPITLPSNFKVFNNKLYFSAKHPDFGIELFEFDGISPPLLVADIREGGAWSAPSGFTEFNNKLYFSANHDTYGRELWMLSNDSLPKLVFDINVGEFGSEPDFLTVFNNKLYFSAYHSDYGIELWEYDGENNPRMVADMNEGGNSFSPCNLIVYSNELWFYAYDSIKNCSLWSYNGQGKPKKAFDLVVTNYKNTKMAILNDELFFVAGDSISGNELYKYNGVDYPELLMDINPGREGSNPTNLSAVNGRLLFSANDGIYGYEIWEYNGKTVPVMLNDIYQGKTSSYPSNFISYNCRLIFSAWDTFVGREMWEYIPEPVIYIEEITSCGSFVTGGGQVIEQSGVYTHTFTNSFGCDSIVELHLNIIDVNTQVDQNNNVLTALAEGARFQWVDCNNNHNHVDGETQAQFSASENGNYAVEVTIGECTLLSDCFSVTGVGFDENAGDNAIVVYPNPSMGSIILDVGSVFEGCYWELTDVSGRKIMQDQIISRLSEIELGTTKGIYFIKVFNNGEHKVKKVTVEW